MTIDPDVTFYGSGGGTAQATNRDCGIKAASPTTNFCTTASYVVGYDGTNASRALLQFNVTGVIPANAQVEYAEMGVYLSAKTASTTTPLAAYPITRSWTTGTTWNKYDGTSNWTTAGGDFSTTASDTIPNVADSLGYKYFILGPLVQNWVNGTTANNGIVVKEPTENVTNTLTFVSSRRTPDNNTWPYLTVSYQPWLGVQRQESYVSQRLSDRMDVQVNVANGNLIYHERDLHVIGTRLDLNLDRFYNAQWADAFEFSPGWSLSTGYDVRLKIFGNGSVSLIGPSNYQVPYLLKRDGTFLTPTAMDATLVQNVGSDYTLTFHTSNMKYNFDSSGNLTTIVDTNGNTLTMTYSTPRHCLHLGHPRTVNQFHLHQCARHPDHGLREPNVQVSLRRQQ